jgi:hypothetical protein
MHIYPLPLEVVDGMLSTKVLTLCTGSRVSEKTLEAATQESG